MPGRARQTMIDDYLALVASLKLIREAVEEAFGAAAGLHHETSGEFPPQNLR